MLHIVKQFIFGLTMILKFDFNNAEGSDSYDTITDTETEYTKESMLKIISIANQLDENKNYLNNNDSINDANGISEELVNILKSLGYKEANLQQLFEDGILISEITTKIEEKFSKENDIKSNGINQRAEIQSELSFNDRIKNSPLSIKELNNLNHEINESSKESKKDIQKLLVALGYDISYTSKLTGKLITGSDAIDGDLGGTYKRVMKEMQKSLSLNETGEFDIYTRSKLATAILSVDHFSQKELNKQDIQKNTENINSSSIEKNNNEISSGVEEFEEQKSGNHISTGMRNETIFNKGEMTREEAISHMKVSSLENLLRVYSAADIVKAISDGTEKYEEVTKDKNGEPILDAEGKEITKTRLNFNGLTSSYSQAEDWLEDKGYDSDGYFGGLEMNSIYTYAVEMMKNQETAKSNNSEQKFKQLIDFDGNGFLQSGKNFYIGELQAEYLNQTDKVGSFITLYDNLGLDQTTLETEMTENYFTAQEKFEQRLSTYLQMGIKPGELFVEGGLEKAMNQMYIDAQEGIETVKDNEAEVLYVKGVVKDALQNKIGGKLPDLDQEAEAIALEAIHVIAGGAKGLAANFNISKFTNDLVRDLSVGVVNGKPGVMISRGFFEKQLDEYDIAISGGLLNVIIPIVTVSADVFNEEFPKTDVINATGDDYKISVFASASTIGQAVGVQYTESSIETSTGIEELGAELGKELDKMIGVLAEDEDAINPIQLSVDESGLTQQQVDAANKLYDNYFSVLQNIEQKITGNEKEKSYFANAKDAIVNGYKDKLYRNIDDKINFASVGVGVAFAADILPVPFVTASFERVKTHFEEQNHSNERERKNTEKILNVDIEKYNGFDAMVFDNNYNISIPQDYQLQANIDNGKLYIGGNINTVRVHEHVTNSEVVRTIVINEGELNKDGLYKTTNEMSDITGDVNIDKKQIFQNNILEAARKTETVRENINILFSNETLTHTKTLGAIALQKDIYSYVNGESKKDISEIFSQLKILVNKHMVDFSKEKGLETNLLDLQVSLDKISSDNIQDILAILQSVNANFMEKDALVENKGVVKMNNTIKEYDVLNNRSRFFDGVFTEKYGPEFSADIKTARESWIASNGDKNEYNFTSSEGNLAMTGVTLGTTGKGVMSYEGVYNIAEPIDGVSEVPLDNNSAYINNLPDTFVKNIQIQLLNVGVELKTLQDVKDFINVGGNSKASITYALAFARMGECLNDAIILKEFSIKAPTKTVSSLTSTMNTQDQNIKTIGITLVDEAREKNKLEESDVESEPTEDGTGDVDNNGEATDPGDTTIEDEGGWNPGGDVDVDDVVDVETAENINRSHQKNIKNIIPNVVHIGNDTGNTGKNMNNN